jgi:hypothetical protein
MINNRKYTAKAFTERMEEFFTWCTENRKAPINYNLANFFGISVDTIANYRNLTVYTDEELEKQAEGDKEKLKELKKDNEERKGLSEAVKKLDKFRTNFWIEIGLSDPKLQTFAIFNLKQPFNGGYSDKQQIEAGGVNIVINPNGVGGDDSFK